MVAVTQVFLRQFVILPLLGTAYLKLQLPLSLFVLLVLATVFITAGGYAINDYFDRKIDRVNKPGTVIVGKLIFPRHAMAYHMVFTTAGVILGTWIAYRTDQLYLSIVFFVVSGLLWFYSTTYKRELILGNIIVALLTALVPFLVLLFELPLLAQAYGSKAQPIARYLMTWVLGFSLFAFLLNLTREIIKDALDFEGDEAYGKKTIPVAWGLQAARWISGSLVVLTIMLLLLAWFFFVPDYITLSYFTVFLVLPLVFVIVILFRSKNTGSWSLAGKMLKLIMLAGLGYMVVVSLIIRTIT
jgi:4-hydroxybenzoate polyprenyltransferase